MSSSLIGASSALHPAVSSVFRRKCPATLRRTTEWSKRILMTDFQASPPGSRSKSLRLGSEQSCSASVHPMMSKKNWTLSMRRETMRFCANALSPLGRGRYEIPSRVRRTLGLLQLSRYQQTPEVLQPKGIVPRESARDGKIDETNYDFE